MTSISAASSGLLVRRPTKSENAQIEKYKIFEVLNEFASSLARATGSPISEDWTPISDAGVVDDTELKDMGIDLSLVCPFKPIFVGYKAVGRKKRDLAHPLSAWALSCTEDTSTTRQALKKRVGEFKAINEENKVSNCVAFPRFLRARKITRNGYLGGLVSVHTMGAFEDDGFKSKMRMVNGFEPRWTQLPCSQHPDQSDRFYDEGSPLLQMENGMLGSPAITYLRLDLHATTTRSGGRLDTPVFSVLIRGVIVNDKLRNWRSWDFDEDSKTSFPSLTESLSNTVLPEVKRETTQSKAFFPESRRSTGQTRSRSRSRSPERSDIGEDDNQRYRQREKSPIRRRHHSEPPLHQEGALGHRQRKIYGRMSAI